MVQDAASNLDVSILSQGAGGGGRFYQPDVRASLQRGAVASRLPSLNNSLMIDKSFMEQATIDHGEADEKEVVVQEVDEPAQRTAETPTFDQNELAKKLQEQLGTDGLAAADSAEDPVAGDTQGAQHDFSYQYDSPRARDQYNTIGNSVSPGGTPAQSLPMSTMTSPSVSELVGQLTIRPRADLEDSDDDRVINVKRVSLDGAEDGQKADEVGFNSEDEGARAGEDAGPVFDLSMHKAGTDLRSEEAQTDL